MKTERAEREAERLVNGVEDAPGCCGRGVNVRSHPDSLAALPWKNKGDLCRHHIHSLVRPEARAVCGVLQTRIESIKLRTHECLHCRPLHYFFALGKKT